MAGGIVSEKKWAPWLPPNTRRWNGASAAGAAKATSAASITAGLTGLPVSTVLSPKAPAWSSRKPPAIALTRAASARLARPITAFCSWISVGTPRRVAA